MRHMVRSASKRGSSSLALLDNASTSTPVDLNFVKKWCLHNIERIQDILIECITALHMTKGFENGISRQEGTIDDWIVGRVEFLHERRKQILPILREIHLCNQTNGFGTLCLNGRRNCTHEFDQMALDNVAILVGKGNAIRSVFIRYIPALFNDILKVHSSRLSYSRIRRSISCDNTKNRHGMTRCLLLLHGVAVPLGKNTEIKQKNTKIRNMKYMLEYRNQHSSGDAFSFVPFSSVFTYHSFVLQPQAKVFARVTSRAAQDQVIAPFL